MNAGTPPWLPAPAFLYHWMVDVLDLQTIERVAHAAGFDAVGVCALDPIERDALDEWLERGWEASMRWMHRQAPKRREPTRIVRGARRAVVVLATYYASDPVDSRCDARAFKRRVGDNAPHLGDSPGHNGRGGDDAPHPGRIARYAWGEDYHVVLRERLQPLADWLVEQGGDPGCTRIYVDAGPVPERELAQRAGLGWIAKNTMLIHPRIGSFTFIGTVFTDLELPVSEAFRADHCGSCRLCLDACPTDAFPRPRFLDSRRCISFLTIEHRGPFSSQQGEMIGEWLFGCDVCQDVCPWNRKFALDHDEPRFGPRAELAQPDADAFITLDEERFQRTFGDTALERPGVKGMRRNAEQVKENRRTTTETQRTQRSTHSSG